MRRAFKWNPFVGAVLALSMAAFFVIISVGPLDVSVMRSVRTGAALAKAGWVLSEDPTIWAPKNPRWIEQGWLVDLLSWALFNGFGPKGLIGARSALFGLCAVGLWLWMIRRGVPWSGGAASVVICGLLAHPRALGMDTMVELVMMTAMLWAIHPPGGRCKSPPWAGLPVLIIWANLGWGFLLGMGMALVHFIFHWRGWGGRERWAYFVALFLAPCMGPNGVKVYGGLQWVPYQWSGPYFQLPSPKWILFLSAALLSVYFILHEGLEGRLFWTWSVAFLGMLVNVQWIPLYLWSCAAMMGEVCASAWSRWRGRPWRARASWYIWTLCVALGLWGLAKARGLRGAPFVTTQFSPKAIEGLRKEDCSKGLLTDVVFSDTVLTVGPKGCLPFLHSQYGSARKDAYRDYVGLLRPPQPGWIRGALGLDPARAEGRWVVRDWRMLLEKYGIHLALLRPNSQLAGLLLSSGQWTVVAADGNGVLFRKKRTSHDHRTLPGGPKGSRWEEPLGAGLRALAQGNPFRAIGAFKAALGTSPQEARVGLAAAYLMLGRERDARDLLESVDTGKLRGPVMQRMEALRERLGGVR